MRPAPIGRLVTISPYDWYSATAPAPDHERHPATHVRTVGARGGTIYEITSIRAIVPRNQLPRGCKGRYAIQAVKLGKVGVDGCAIPDDARVISLQWTPRNTQRRR